jgi:uncharacterized protein YbjT (DUF2867 family)
MGSKAVLLVGASGFVGRALAQALLERGHDVTCALRDPSRLEDRRMQAVSADLTRDTAQDWLPRLAGIDVVINAAGIVREENCQTFEAIHTRGPIALFSACAQARTGLVLQISALGADAGAETRFHLSKKSADDFLASLPVASIIAQPSLIHGEGGASARLFSTMAALPLIPLPGTGDQQIQPVHIDDVVDALLAMVEAAGATTAGVRRVPLVGPRPLSLRNYLAALRRGLGLGAAHFFPLPMPLIRFAAQAGRLLPGGLLDRDTLRMLERGNTAPADPFSAVLGRSPRAADQFAGAGDRGRAQLGWLLPLLRWSIALVWIVTGIVSLGLYPVQESYALLARAGVEGALAPPMLYGAAALDLAFGIAILVCKRRSRLWLAQIGVILLYTAIITLRLPEFWLHPYGPLLKNLPMLAAIWLLYELEKRPR